MSELIDLETAKEFMKEILEKVGEDDLIKIANELQLKSDFFKEKLNTENIEKLEDDDLDEIFKIIFSTRRNVSSIFKKVERSEMKNYIKDLLHGSEKIDIRFQKFFDELGEIDKSIKFDLAGELLHYTYPNKYWLWGRWMWDPKNKTGAIPLVTSEGFDLEGESEGEVYMKVGKGVAFVHSVAEFAGFQFISRSLFATDVYLTCVYIIYAYTILRMRMTKEFNNVMPGLVEFSKRILGIYQLKVA
jgi:hypothetical protein